MLMRNLNIDEPGGLCLTILPAQRSEKDVWAGEPDGETYILGDYLLSQRDHHGERSPGRPGTGRATTQYRKPRFYRHIQQQFL